MKFKTYGMVLSLIFALGLVFSFGIEASASHGDDTGITAEEVDPKDKADVEAFLDHMIDYYHQAAHKNIGDETALTRELTIVNRDFRREGPYKHSATEVYGIGVNERARVTNHARYPHLYGYEFDSGDTNSAVASTIQALIDKSGLDMTACEEDYDGQGRVACARKVISPVGDVTAIAGLHHAESDSPFNFPDCPEFMLDTTAQEVFASESDDDLEDYVKGVIEVYQRLFADIQVPLLLDFFKDGGDLTDPTELKKLAEEVNKRLFDKAACIRSMDFSHENIYSFIMDSNPETSTVLINGNNFDLNGANLELEDDQLSGEQNIARLFNQKLGDPVNGASTYVNYHWDDPTTTDDDVPNFFEERKVPGTSCKRSYIEVADLNALGADAFALVTGRPAAALAPLFPPRLYIFGSGTYPGDDVCDSGDDGGEMMAEDDDDGCAIAGAGHTSQSTLLNLFLIASVLFSVVFLRRRV